MKKILWMPIWLVVFSCQPQGQNEVDYGKLQQEAQSFIDQYTQGWLPLYSESAEAAWIANTKIVDGDTVNAIRVQVADEALSAYTGSGAVIEQAGKWLERKEYLAPFQIKQLEAILYQAANNPATAEDLVKQRITAENAQTEKLFKFDFKINNRIVSANDIDNILKSDINLRKRQQAWEASKEVGRELKAGLENLRDLRNQTVQALDYSDYFTYQVSDYGMTVDEMMALNKKIIQDIWPLYRELHTYTRYELAKKYKQAQIPEYLPAHWLPNRWGQDWSSMIEVEGIDLDGVLEEKGAEWLVKQAEDFYISLGFEALPESFYTHSSLYPLPEGSPYKKNNHASAWHMDLQDDVRSLMSVIPNAEWYETTHHELGHIYYYISYTNPDVPPLLRGGANRAFHEAVGSLMGLAAMQKPYLARLDLIPAEVETDEISSLLKEALNYIVFIPFSTGVMTHFEHDLYKDSLSIDQFNQRWWELAKKYQGIVPPTERDESYCDAASKTHINNDAAQYYDYALSNTILFQLHNHIATSILKQDPRATNYYESKEVGKFMKDLLSPGATGDWRTLLQKTTGEQLGAQAMLNYFHPLMDYLKEINQGRAYTLPESID